MRACRFSWSRLVSTVAEIARLRMQYPTRSTAVATTWPGPTLPGVDAPFQFEVETQAA
jgi:hypothetical protein